MAYNPLMAIELQNQIDRATKEIEQNYQIALGELGELKRKINDLELIITDNANAKTSAVMDKLNSAINKLIKLTDSMISESERAWEVYKKLEHDSRIDASEPSKLNAQMSSLREVCKKTDEFATDLLCYSLAHFKRKDA
jgi:hypothetical protein